MEVRVRDAAWIAALWSVGTFGCDSGPCPSGTLLVENACIAIEGGDENCEAPTALYRDVDGDGFGDPNEVSAGCKRAGFSERAEDCDDSNPDMHPEAPEQCNDLDDDCDGVVDDDPEIVTWYRDLDEDGFGDGDVETESCLRPEGYVSNAADCEDDDRAVSPTAPELCNERDDNCNGVTDDGPGMECALGDVVACTTECGTVGTAACTAECLVSAACNPPIETCNFIDDDCDGVTDEALLTASVASTFDVHDGGMVETSARLVSAKNGLFLFYFGRQWIHAAQSAVVRLYVVKIGDDGHPVGTPKLIRESPAGNRPGPIDVVAVGYSAYVAIPPTDTGPELLRVSLVDLFEITSVGVSPQNRWIWQGQCLATDGTRVAWGNVYRDGLWGQQPFRNDFLVSFYDNALVPEASHGVGVTWAKTEGLTCALIGPRAQDNKWLAAYYADESLYVQALTAEGGMLDGFRDEYGSSAVRPMMAWDAEGRVIVSTDGWAEGARRYAVDDRFVLEDSLSGFAGNASGGSLIEGGTLFTTTTDGVDIRETGDLNRFLQYLTPGGVETIVEHEGQIYAADAPPDGAVTLTKLGCL